MDAPVEETRFTNEDDDHGDEREEEEAEEEEEEGEGEVWAWSWGAGTDGQLGTGAARDEHLPQPLSVNPLSSPSTSSSPPLRVSRVACGGAHAVALTGDGRVLTWGRGVHGQLGHGELENCLQPKPVQFFESFTVCSVSAGWNHSGFVTDEGRLFMCGDNSFGQLGTGDNRSYNLPVEVLFFTPKHVEQIACGMRHTIALVAGDLVYGFGSARHGQIGNSVSKHKKSCNLPEVIQGLGSCKIVGLFANGDHSAALTANGELYIWGRGFSGASDELRPRLLRSFLRISQVALGWHHALVLADGEVYMLGGYRHWAVSGSHVTNPVQRQSVLSAPCTTVSDVRTLEMVPCLEGERVAQIAAGAEHSALLTERGKIMTWGWGEHGQLGSGNSHDRTFPQIVNIPNWRSSASALGIYCGSGFTIATKTA